MADIWMLDVDDKVNLEEEFKFFVSYIFLLHFSGNKRFENFEKLNFVAFVEVLLNQHQICLGRHVGLFFLTSC